MSVKWNDKQAWIGVLCTAGLFPALLFLVLMKEGINSNNSALMLGIPVAFIGGSIVIGVPFLILYRRLSLGRAILNAWLYFAIGSFIGSMVSKFSSELSPVYRFISNLFNISIPSIIALWSTSSESGPGVSGISKDSLVHVWATKSDEMLIEAASHLSDYTVEGAEIIQAELQCRGLIAPPSK